MFEMNTACPIKFLFLAKMFSYKFLLWTEIWTVSHSNILAFMGHVIFISEKQIDPKNGGKDFPIVNWKVPKCVT